MIKFQVGGMKWYAWKHSFQELHGTSTGYKLLGLQEKETYEKNSAANMYVAALEVIKELRKEIERITGESLT